MAESGGRPVCGRPRRSGHRGNSTVAVEYGLDFALEVEPSGRPVPRSDLVDLAGPLGDVDQRRGIALALVTADAGYPLARHRRIPTAHQLHGLAFAVERLHGDGCIGRHAEQRGAVRLDRHRAQDPHHVPWPVDADRDGPARPG